MVRIGFRERVRQAASRAKGADHTASARVVSSALARWRQGARGARHLVIVPPELRAADPSFWPEVASGHFGLSGAVATLNGRSPFAVEAPSAAWARELHSFSWLRHLEAAGEPAAEAAARQFLDDWMRRPGPSHSHAGVPAVRARRILSWIAHAPLLLEGATEAEFDRFALALARDVVLLGSGWQRTPDGAGRLLAATALVVARLAIEGADRRLPQALDRLDAEIERQILPDGGHVSRNPAVLVELLLDWLPVKSCLEARGLEPSTALVSALNRMLAMLRFLRLGDGGIARFNGLGVADPAGVATLLAYDDAPPPACAVALSSQYARLSCAGTVLIADVGSPPPLAASTSAQAGCLSIEVSARGVLLLCNGGAPGKADSAWRAVARATASHSSICVKESSSSQLVRNARIEASMGAPPLQGPQRVVARVKMDGEDAVLTAWHDGYLERFNIEHHREVRLSCDGAAIHGRDRLATPGGQDRLKRDVPFAIHFHLHPGSTCEPSANGGMAGETGLLIGLADGQQWVFRAPSQRTAIEESLHFACTSGPRPALQIVIRGATGGMTEVAWALTRVGQALRVTQFTSSTKD